MSDKSLDYRHQNKDLKKTGSITDEHRKRAMEEPRIATPSDCRARWRGAGPGVKFRCDSCDTKFKVGDLWRWQESDNRLLCNRCDTRDSSDTEPQQETCHAD